ncbi:MAG: signal peptidase I [Minisyncoccia bacterium]
MANMEDKQNKEIEQTQAQVQTETKPTFKEEVKEFIRFFIIALAIIIPIRLYIMQPFVVSGLSMFPTFHDKDYLIIDKLSYELGTPHRGDVVVFQYPGDPSKYFIKRMVGLPGDRVVITAGKVTIYNTQHPEGLKLDETTYVPDPQLDTIEKTVPENSYYVMGDNRKESYDSRSWGFVPKKLLTGRAFLRLYPFNAINILPGKVVQE